MIPPTPRAVATLASHRDRRLVSPNRQAVTYWGVDSNRRGSVERGKSHDVDRLDLLGRLAGRAPSTLVLASTAWSSPGNRASTSSDRRDSMRRVPSGRIRTSPATRKRAR